MTHDATSQIRLNRRQLVFAGGVSAISLQMARAQDDEAEGTPESTPTSIITSSAQGEMPTYGGSRTSPVGSLPEESATAGATIPVTITVETIGINAQVEQLGIVDGVMESPTGPWVVSWYRETAELGEVGNVVLAGHVDYWNVGPSVFYNIRNLVEGDEIVLTGENGTQYTYAVESAITYTLEELISGTLSEVVGPTAEQVVTLITCGGEFDYVNGEYLSRTVVRGSIKPIEVPESTPEDED